MSPVETLYKTLLPSSRQPTFKNGVLTVGTRTAQMADYLMDACPAMLIQDGGGEPKPYPIRDGKVNGFDLTDLAHAEILMVEPNYSSLC